MSLYSTVMISCSGGHIGIRPSACTSVRVPSCPLWSTYSSRWILSYYAQMITGIRGCVQQNDLLTFTYIFKFNQPCLCNRTVEIWHTLLCPLCITYNSGWILFIFGTNDHYHDRVCHVPWSLTLSAWSHLLFLMISWIAYDFSCCYYVILSNINRITHKWVGEQGHEWIR